MFAHPPRTSRCTFAGLRRCVAVGCLGLLALTGGLLFTAPSASRPAPVGRLPAIMAGVQPTNAGKAPPPGKQTAEEGMERIESADAFPLTAVVHIEITFPDGFRAIGSGDVVDRTHVLTAGHVVFASHHGGWAKAWSVYAGRTGATTPFEVAHGVKARTFTSFIDDDKASTDGRHKPGDGDVGLITLDRPLGDETGWFGFGVQDDDFFAGRALYKAGYPGKPYSGRDLYLSHGAVLGAHAGTAPSFGFVDWDVKSMPAIGGQSGSGLYDVDEAGQTIIYAVHDLGNSERGFAEVITKDVFEAIQGWIAEDSPPDRPDDPNGPDGPPGPDGPDDGENP
jgi:V8-like Glu-specific endopeptidase